MNTGSPFAGELFVWTEALAETLTLVGALTLVVELTPAEALGTIQTTTQTTTQTPPLVGTLTRDLC